MDAFLVLLRVLDASAVTFGKREKHHSNSFGYTTLELPMHFWKPESDYRIATWPCLGKLFRGNLLKLEFLLVNAATCEFYQWADARAIQMARQCLDFVQMFLSDSFWTCCLHCFQFYTVLGASQLKAIQPCYSSKKIWIPNMIESTHMQANSNHMSSKSTDTSQRSSFKACRQTITKTHTHTCYIFLVISISNI